MEQNLFSSIVIEDSQGTNQISTSALLAGNGKIFLPEFINSTSAGMMIRQIMCLSDKNIPITIFIDSLGGEIKAGLMLIDVLDAIGKKVTIDMVCLGKAYSMAAVILASGKKGHRLLLPHSEILVHEPILQSGAGGSASTVKSTAESLLAARDDISKMMSKYTGNSTKMINSIMKKNTFLNAEEAIKFGVADKIIDTI